MACQEIAIGVVLRSFEVPAWQFHMLKDLRANGNLTISPLVLTCTSNTFQGQEKESKLVSILRNFGSASHRSSRDSCTKKNISGILSGVISIQQTACPGSSDFALDSESSRKIAEKNFDVILMLEHLDWIDYFCRFSKSGAWYFWHDFGQTRNASGSRVGFWEVIKRRPYIRSALMICNPKFRKDILAYESYSGIQYSFRQSRDEHLWKVSSFFSRALKSMQRQGNETYLLGLAKNNQSELPQNSSQVWRLTTANLLVPMTGYVLWRLWRKAIGKIFTERWTLLFSLSGESEHTPKFTALSPPKGRFWADPHIVRRNGAYYVFFEDASISSGRGHIAVMRMEKDGKFSSPTSVIERDYHLAYPFVFEWQDQLYMIPESAENQSIELYRCRNFPGDWVFSHNLMENILAYDTTLVEHDDIWWLFANVKLHEGASTWDELCLFYSDSPISTNWSPHPLNPVVSDVRRARPAGNIFARNGNLYRPSQNCSYRYGYGLNINRIIELSTTSYNEAIARKILPEWHRTLRCVHTFSKEDQLVMIDAIRRTRREK